VAEEPGIAPEHIDEIDGAWRALVRSDGGVSIVGQ